MFVALHWKTFKPALPNMPAAAVMFVLTPYVTGQEPLHESAQRLVMRSFNPKCFGIREKANILTGCRAFASEDGKGLVI
jgi:hypothetical protein